MTEEIDFRSSGESISYANPKTTSPPMSVSFAKWICGLAYVPAIGGVLLLGLYWLTASRVVVQTGLLWLPCSVLWIIVLAVFCSSGMKAANARSPKDPTDKFYFSGMFAIFVNPFILFICLKAGSYYVEDCASANVIVKNATSVSIDHVTVMFPDRSIDFSGVPPHASRGSGFVWLETHGGNVEIETRVGSKSKRKVDRHASGRILRQGIFEIIIEDNELPSDEKTPQP